jgi:putative membrane protein insertion efficiency factor
MSRPLDACAPAPLPAEGVAVRGALLVLRAYKLLLSPLFTGACRFHPSCSTYAADALRAHGLVAGTWLSVRRLARCHPLGGSGYDPVPPHRASGTPPR